MSQVSRITVGIVHVRMVPCIRLAVKIVIVIRWLVKTVSPGLVTRLLANGQKIGQFVLRRQLENAFVQMVGLGVLAM